MRHRPRDPAKIDKDIEALYRDEGSGLFRTALTATQGNREMAEDLVQGVFESAIKAWPEVGIRDAEGRRRWLYRVLRNKQIDIWRRGRRIDLDPELLERRLLDLEAHADPADIVVEGLSDEQLWQWLKFLSPMEYRVLFLLCRWGWKTAEIATVLDVSSETVRVHKSNAKKKLVDLKAELFGDIAEGAGEGIDGARVELRAAGPPKK